MNLMKSSKCLPLKSKWFPVNKDKGLSAGKVYRERFVHGKSLPPLRDKQENKELEEIKGNNILSTKVDRMPRDIFGATILPQNLSFENSKKLTENAINLKDIPLVDENEAAETLAAEKMRARSREGPGCEGPAEEQNEEAFELFWVVPDPGIVNNLAAVLKNCVRRLAVAAPFLLGHPKASALFRGDGPVAELPDVLGQKILLVSQPEVMSAIFEQDRRRPGTSSLDSVQRSRVRGRGKNDIGEHMSEGWELLRKSMAETPARGSEKYFDGLDEAAGKFVGRIRSLRDRRNQVPGDFLFEINKWSLECMCSVIFDESLGLLDCDRASLPLKTTRLLYFLTIATENLCHLERGFQFWRFFDTPSLYSLGSACDVLESIISEHVSQVQLDLIERGSAHSGKANASWVEGLLLRKDLPPADVIASILDALLIGTNTTAVALAFLFYHLARNPRAQRQLWREVKEILPEKYSRLEHEQLPSLRYLQACLKESLRLKMPMPVHARLLSRNVVLGNSSIPEGTFVLMTAQVEALKKENFQDPEEFVPERWLAQDRAHPFAYLPVTNYFDDCFQRRIAESSLWVCASQVVRHFCIDYAYEDIQATSTAISFPNKPLKFTFADRNE